MTAAVSWPDPYMLFVMLHSIGTINGSSPSGDETLLAKNTQHIFANPRGCISVQELIQISNSAYSKWLNFKKKCKLRLKQEIFLTHRQQCICIAYIFYRTSLQWRHNERNGVSNHQRLNCLLKCRFRCRSKKTSKLCVTGLCGRWIPHTKASNAGNVSIWWCHHFYSYWYGKCYVCKKISSSNELYQKSVCRFGFPSVYWVIDILWNNKIGFNMLFSILTQYVTNLHGNHTGNSRCHTLASRALNMSRGFDQSARDRKQVRGYDYVDWETVKCTLTSNSMEITFP